ncbi:hypothetical protein M419DRAFT_4505 [Trichoderma reesei RUT C-30]|uniref:Uncharacterized protein n=1 Tax=Hypocrea jecorina (strain ATCC 56765 / BCRC 32924 / NRRL 11460 / Rut C-30) TaxID=1344414 RepID=A0A024SJK1_HYPJR|nr:hypothetical protein M419DRAFT_4505 [Trichoderma reesei RUT C-30]
MCRMWPLPPPRPAAAEMVSAELRSRGTSRRRSLIVDYAVSPSFAWPRAKELTMSLISAPRLNLGQAELHSYNQVQDRATRKPCADSRAEAGVKDEELVAQS